MRHIYAATLVAAVGLCAPAMAAPTVYSSASAFSAATTGVTTVNFEGAATTTWILQPGSYSTSGVTITQPTNNAFMSDPTYTPYYYNWGTGDVINTPYNGTLTITFAAPVTAFGIDLGTFYDDNDPKTPCCAASTFYGLSVKVGTAQGDFVVDLAKTETMSFFGLTSDTAFTSFTITGTSTNAFASTVFDNIRYGSAAPVPEPASWALMIGGLGLVGAAMRRRATAGARLA